MPFAPTFGLLLSLTLFSLASGPATAQESQPAEKPAATEPVPKARQGRISTEPSASQQAPGSTGNTTGQPVTPTKSAPAPSKPPRRSPPRKKSVQADGTPKKVVRQGGTSEPQAQLGPEVSQQQISQERQTTSQLLALTNANLQRISTLQLSSGQQDTLKQIHNFVEQAKVAEKAGDFQRAQNLADKAHQLSDDLVKP